MAARGESLSLAGQRLRSDQKFLSLHHPKSSQLHSARGTTLRDSLEPSGSKLSGALPHFGCQGLALGSSLLVQLLTGTGSRD